LSFFPLAKRKKTTIIIMSTTSPIPVAFPDALVTNPVSALLVVTLNGYCALIFLS